MKKQAQIKRRTIIAVPVVTSRQLRQIQKVVGQLRDVSEAVDECWRNLEASLTVLTGENLPEDWHRVRVLSGRKIERIED